MIKKIDFLKTSKLIAFALLFLCAVVFAQAPGIQWQKLYGGSSYEWFYKTIPTSDGGYIAVGQAASTNGDVTGTGYTKQDAWIVKTDACGNKQWDKILGGDGSDENFYDIKQTNDGGYIVVGSSDSSNNGTVSVTGKGLTDVWVVKLNSSGATQWQKLYGGSRPDQGYSVSQTLDGGYIVGGTTQSVDGDLSGNTSVLVKPVVMKLDTNGNLNWVKTYIWQSDWEILSEIIQTADGGYIFVGNSFNSGNSDAIAYKLNSTGVVTWKQLYGGNGYDRFANVRSTSDGGYIVAGYSDTSNNGSVSATNHGGSDVWLVKLTSAGSKSWDTLLGGSGEEKITNSNTLIVDMDGGYVICSSSTSSNSGNVTDTNHGAQDAWVFKTNSSGVIQWQKLIGGTADDQLFSIYNTANNNYILAGYSESSASGDIKDTNKGSLDAWLLKLGDVTPTPVITTTSATCFSAGTATISNYNASYSYTFLPVGPTIGTNGLISGMAVGTNYTVTASGGNCTSATSVSFSIAAQLSGASCTPCTSQRIINSSLVYSGEYTGWTLANTDVTRPSGSNQGVNFQRDGQINDLTQNLTKVNPQGNTSPVFNIKIGPYDAVPQASSNKASLEFYYDNVLYMRISTTNGVTTGGANVNYFNGASGNYATKVPMNTSGVGATVSATVQLTLPATVSNFGQLKIHYDGSGTTPVDDFYIGEVSLITTVATPAIPTVTTTVATCSSDGTATISNYNPSYTYTFTPTGPTVGPTGLISGMITGTNYIVKASIEGCQSSASNSFKIAPQLTICPTVCGFDKTNGGNNTPVSVTKSNITVNTTPTITYLQNASVSASGFNEFDFGGVNLTNSTGNTIPNVLVDVSKIGFWTQNVPGTAFKLYTYNQANQSWEGTLGNGQVTYFKILGVSVNGSLITNPNVKLIPIENSASVTGYHFASTGNTVSDVATSFTDGGTGSSYSITGATVSLPQNLPVIDLGALANGATLSNVKIRMGLAMPNNADAWVNNPDTGTGDIDYYVYGFADVWGTGYDFGDALSSYGIAQHAPAICSPAIYIGPNRQDYESSVTGNTTADADDLNMPNYDDENDNLPDYSAGQTSYSVTLPYVNNAASGSISAWIDWNNNGIFDTSEQATATISTGNANATLTWRISGATIGEGTIPASVPSGYKVVRTRIGTISSEILNPFGIATDGEVEDRLLFVTGYCTKPGDFSQSGTPTKVGITNQTRLSGWPESIPNGYIALESKDKGFVITRVPHVSTTPDFANDSIKDPKEGMIVYDIQDKCVKLYNGTVWNCIQRSCNN